MRFFEVVLSGAALLSTAFAVEFNSWPQALKAGDKITLTYSPKDAATTIILRKGPSTDLDTLDTLTTSSTGGSFEWTVPSSLANGADYAFEIRQAGAQPNYSGQIPLTGGSAASASASSSASKSASASESSTKGYSTPESHSTSATESSSFKTTASASATIAPSHGSNSTVVTRTPSATQSSPSSTKTGEQPPVENSGAASAFGTNPVAIFMGAAAALAYFA
jgi:hypothetical protein